MPEDKFKTELLKKTESCEKIILSKLPPAAGNNATVIKAMDYSVTAGGKRLRPVMMQAAYELFAGDIGVLKESLSVFMSAIEFIHTYSLVHDDLPAMDNDEFRRGRETTWKVFGDGMGVLAGDALLNYAFEIMADETCRVLKEYDDTELAHRCARASKVLSEKAGFSGMIGGQCADIEGEGKKDLSAEDILYIHEHKTGCLIEAALMIGGIMGGAGEGQVSDLEKIGSDVGIAFQIRDDILDIYGNSEELGKNTGSDEAAGKVTYVTLNGLQKSEEEVVRLSREACSLLEGMPGEKQFLLSLFENLINRTK